ncbi:hypothetical protein VE01_04866 [Pseudogymnoascus verrucosus]|uniref:Uncharacterized protein n=1 Tax=Pseudogymnoascus verrucosus TaxID=342668 RepID=A0A1B8GMU0_9PEZI|nr:uncharacterized protein VE01_04866 [Pseudogymnoascus verrucosus]OBT97155.1 hypothetical protein VE01_04866 [Pseudogymnoascus verrucosus]
MSPSTTTSPNEKHHHHHHTTSPHLLSTPPTTTDLEKQPLPPPAPSSLYADTEDGITDTLRSRAKAALQTFLTSIIALEGVYDFLAAGLRMGVLAVQALCLGGVAWEHKEGTFTVMPVVYLIVMIVVLQMVQMGYCVLDAISKYTKVMEFMLRIEELNLPRGEDFV